MTAPAPAPCLLPRGQALVASSAVVLGDVTLGPRVSIWYGAVVRGDCDAISIGELTNVQDGAVVHADTGVPNDIGAGVTIGHRAVVHGRRVGDRCLIGIGAVLLGGCEIGAESIVAAGAVVREAAIIPPRTLVAGVPARSVRAVTEQEFLEFLLHAEHYWELAGRHAQG